MAVSQPPSAHAQSGPPDGDEPIILEDGVIVGEGVSDAIGSAADAGPPPADTDRDGVSDVVERATGTGPLRADTDRDGVVDGVEDADRDGVLDVGETDPRVPGLFPGGYPHIPEPMVFDLVRGLGAKKGEVEVNTLAVLNLRRSERGLSWAPEVEWAFADGAAIELELPMHDRELEAVKFALQLTVPDSTDNFTHGVQLIGEYLLDQSAPVTAALYVAGGRIGSWSMLTMAGFRADTPTQGRNHYEALLNPSVYHDLSEKLTLGLEGNLSFGFTGSHAFAVIPQVHWQISRTVRIQAGGGAHFVGNAAGPLLSTRVILE